MNLQVPGPNVTKHPLENLVACTAQGGQESMSLAVDEVKSRQSTVLTNIPGAHRSNLSFDETWHRRGHYSNQGFGAAIDAESIKVLDYKLYQRICRKCAKCPLERQKSEPDDYYIFISEHKPLCSANFSGTSQAMEGSAALELWRRSFEKNRLVYLHTLATAIALHSRTS